MRFRRNQMTIIDERVVKKVFTYRWIVFATLTLAYFFVYFHRVSTAVVATDIMSTFKVNATSIGLLSSAYFYAYTLMQLPSGILADSWGPRKTVSIFTLIAAVGAVLTGVATTFILVVTGRVLIGLGVAMVYIPIMKVLAEWFKSNEFASLTGILLAVGNIGALSAAAPLAILSNSFGWQEVYLILGGFTVLLAIMAYVLVRDRPKDMGLPSIEEIEAYQNGETLSEHKNAQEKISMKQALKMTFGSGMKFWPLAVWYFFMYGSLMVYQGLWAGPFFSDVLGWEKSTYASVLTLIAVGMIFGCPIAGFLSDKVLKSRRKVLMIGTAIYTLIWAYIWLSAGSITSTTSYLIIHFLFGFFGGWFIVSYAQIKELFPLSIAGTTTAALNIFPFLGGAVLQQVTGAMITTQKATVGALAAYRSVWFLMFVCMLIATICTFLSKEKNDGRTV
jgi:sugar phosphate permease